VEHSFGSTDTQTALLEPTDTAVPVLAAHTGLYFGWAGFWMVVRDLYEGGVSAFGSDGTKYFVPYGEPVSTSNNRLRRVLGKPETNNTEREATVTQPALPRRIPAASFNETPIAEGDASAEISGPAPAPAGAADGAVALSANLLPARLLAWARAGGQLPDLFAEAARRLQLEGPDSDAIENIKPSDLMMVLDQAIGSFDSTLQGV